MPPFERDFDYESLTFEKRKGLHDALGETTVKHIVSSDGLFSAREYNPANVSQALETTHLPPAPTTRERLDGLAGVAGPDLYPFAKERLKQERSLMSAARLLLKAGHNLHLVTGPHTKIGDVAVFDAGWTEHLDQDNWQEQSGLIISRGVSTIEAFGESASEIVQELGHVFMTFPRTGTIENLVVRDGLFTSDELDSLIKTNNKNMRKEIRSWLGIDLAHRLGRSRNTKSLIQAWEGKTARVEYGEDQKPASVEFQKVYPGVIDVIRHGYVLPVTLLEGEQSVLEFGEITTVKTEADIQRVQEWQRATLASKLGLDDEAVTIKS